MTDDPSPTLRRRELGAHLRRLRTERGWTTRDVAEQLGFSVSKVSRMETGARGVNAKDMASLTELFGLDDAWSSHLDSIARTGKKRFDKRSAIVVETDFIGMEDPGFVDLESDAARIREYNSSIIPGLLQTEEYMRPAMLGSAPDVARSSIDRAVAARCERQKVLRRVNPPTFEVVVDEAALRRQVGGAAAMRRQIEYLVACVEQGVVELAVIPFRVGAHPGLNSDFVALRIEEPAALDVVFVEGLAGHLRFEREVDVLRYQRVWEKLLDVALPAQDAPGVLAKIASNPDARL